MDPGSSILGEQLDTYLTLFVAGYKIYVKLLGVLTPCKQQKSL